MTIYDKSTEVTFWKMNTNILISDIQKHGILDYSTLSFLGPTICLTRIDSACIIRHNSLQHNKDKMDGKIYYIQ